MYKKTLLILCVLGLTSVSFAADTSSGDKVIAYYLHGNSRCANCYKLEKYSKEAIETNFKTELVLGRLAFKSINTDEKGNEHFINNYRLYTKSLVLSLIKDGKEVKSKNLTEIWNYAGNKQKFFDYITGEIDDFLKGD